MRGGGGGEGGPGTRRSSPELVLSVSSATERERGGRYEENQVNLSVCVYREIEIPFLFEVKN